jgi:hypothetical protein
MVIKGILLQSHLTEAGVPQYSPVSPVLFTIHTEGLTTGVEEIA